MSPPGNTRGAQQWEQKARGGSEKSEVRAQEEDATEWRGPGQGEGGEARSKLYGLWTNRRTRRFFRL